MTAAAVIFDMDGLLIDSEPFWAESEAEIFGALGVPVSPELMRPMMGLHVTEVVRAVRHRHPWSGPTDAEVVHAIVTAVRARIEAEGTAMPGVDSALALARNAGCALAVASASPRVLIDAVLAKLGLADTFAVVRSADTEPYGKPHPGVYLSAAAELGVDPVTCVALEDSPNGVLAAKAARMRCIAVPDPHVRGDARFGIADAVLPSLEHLTPELLRGS